MSWRKIETFTAKTRRGEASAKGFRIVALLLATSLLISCDRNLSGISGDERVHIRIWISPQMTELGDFDFYAALRRQFEKENPGIAVEVEVIPWSRRMQKMITASIGDRAPDAAYIGLDFLPRFIQLDMIRPVDEFMSAEERSDYDPRVLESASDGGKLWLYPVDRSVVAAVYNKGLFAEAGLDPEKPPRTWDDVERMAKAITADTDHDGRIDRWGVAYILGGDTLNMSFWPLLWQAGGDVLSADGRHAAFAGAEGLDALNFVCGLWREGAIPGSYMGYGANEFAAGRVGYWWGAAAVQFVQLRRDAPQLKLGVAPVLERKQRLSYSTVGSFCIFSTSRHPAETARWLSFVCRPENMKSWCRAVYRLPTKKSVGRIWDDDSDLAEFERQAEFCRFDVKSIYARQIMSTVIPEIQHAVLGQKTPEQALSDAAAASDKILNSGQ